MSETKCRLCGGTTNQKTGFCRPCELFKKDEVEALKAKEEAIEKITDIRKTKKEPVIPAQAGIQNPKEEKMKEKKKYLCSTDNCGRAVQKDGLCYICYKAKHGFSPYSSKAKTEKKLTPQPSASPLKIRGEKGSYESKNPRDNGTKPKDDNLIRKLMDAKAGYQQKITEIDNAIEVLRQYA